MKLYSKSNYKIGNCDIFALALHEVFGYQLAVIRGFYKDDENCEDEEPYQDCHAVAIIDSNNVVDIDGVKNTEQVKRDCFFDFQVSRIEIIKVSPEEMSECFSSEAVDRKLVLEAKKVINDNIQKYMIGNKKSASKSNKAHKIFQMEDEDWYNIKIAGDQNTSPEILKRILDKGNDDYISWNSASNPNCPPEALKMVLERKLNDGVSMNAASNPNCPPEALKMVLERKLDDEVSQNAAGNSNCPPEALKMVLERKLDDWVSRYAAYNPNCPPEALKMVLERKLDDWVSLNAALNPNCPLEALKMVLERGKYDGVSHFAAKNPNCPLEARIRWMMATGQITEYDPNNPDHHIELEDKPQDNTALDEFRKLVSKSENWYKKSQTGKWYTEETASDQETSPEILKRILEIGNDDYVSRIAAQNPNCPPEALKMILEKGENDYISLNAARNPNCPPEALKMVLERKLNDVVSKYAASNPNCPPEVLKMILERKLDDGVSCYAALNTNCPPEALKMILERKLNDLVSYYAVFNPNCPPEALKMVLERKLDDVVSRYAVKNPNCPLEALKMVLERNLDDSVSRCAVNNPNCPPELLKMVLERKLNDGVSREAAGNPNCPPEARMRWMMATGKITEYDPNNPDHHIELEDKPQDNTALDEFRKLLSKSNNWYKKSQIEESDLAPIEPGTEDHIFIEDVEDMLQRGFNQNSEALKEEGFFTWKEWFNNSTDYEISLVIDSDSRIHYLYFNDLPEGIMAIDVVRAYRSGMLKHKSHSNRTQDSFSLSDESDYEPNVPWHYKRKMYSDEDLIKYFGIAKQRVVKSNSEEVYKAKREIFLAYNYKKDLAELLGIKVSELKKLIRSWSGISANSLRIQELVNSNVGGEHQWSGIQNVSFLNSRSVKPEEVDRFVKKIEVDETSRTYYWGNDGEIIRRFIMSSFMAIDTGLSYSDLSFVVKNLKPSEGKKNPPLGLYVQRENTIYIGEVGKRTIAHEIGHYLDYKFASEFKAGLSTPLSEMVSIEGSSKQHSVWRNKYKDFVKSIMLKSDINSEYTQSNGEVFARFIASFVAWVSKKANVIFGDTGSFQDRFDEYDYRRFISLLQEKSYIDKHFGREIG